ncbi:hypothetical protein AAMO2058_001243800 [Amorphochlora amoebiformis]
MCPSAENRIIWMLPFKSRLIRMPIPWTCTACAWINDSPPKASCFNCRGPWSGKIECLACNDLVPVDSKTCPQCRGDLRTKTIVIIGNPGVGKSIIVNTTVGRLVFKSGLSNDGSGVTKGQQGTIIQTGHLKGNRIIDTPGLADVQTRNQTAKSIESALKTPRSMLRIVFVMDLTRAGRILPDDLATVNTVLEAVQDEFAYGIIINKLSKKLMQQIPRGMLIDNIRKSVKSPPANILFLANDQKAEDMPDMLLSKEGRYQEKLTCFIHSLPFNHISQSSDVKVSALDWYLKERERLLREQVKNQERKEALGEQKRQEELQREQRRLARENELRQQKFAEEQRKKQMADLAAMARRHAEEVEAQSRREKELHEQMKEKERLRRAKAAAAARARQEAESRARRSAHASPLPAPFTMEAHPRLLWLTTTIYTSALICPITGGGTYGQGQACLAKGLPNGGNSGWQGPRGEALCCKRTNKFGPSISCASCNTNYPITACGPGCCTHYRGCLCWDCVEYPHDCPEGCWYNWRAGCVCPTPSAPPTTPTVSSKTPSQATTPTITAPTVAVESTPSPLSPTIPPMSTRISSSTTPTIPPTTPSLSLSPSQLSPTIPPKTLSPSTRISSSTTPTISPSSLCADGIKGQLSISLTPAKVEWLDFKADVDRGKEIVAVGFEIFVNVKTAITVSALIECEDQSGCKTFTIEFSKPVEIRTSHTITVARLVSVIPVGGWVATLGFWAYDAYQLVQSLIKTVELIESIKQCLENVRAVFSSDPCRYQSSFLEEEVAQCALGAASFPVFVKRKQTHLHSDLHLLENSQENFLLTLAVSGAKYTWTNQSTLVFDNLFPLRVTFNPSTGHSEVIALLRNTSTVPPAVEDSFQPLSVNEAIDLASSDGDSGDDTAGNRWLTTTTIIIAAALTVALVLGCCCIRHYSQMKCCASW